MSVSQPLSICLANDYDIVLQGLRRILEPYRDRFQVVDCSPKPSDHVDIALFDSFGHNDALPSILRELQSVARADKYVLFTWAFNEQAVQSAESCDISGVLSKSLTGGQLVAALDAVHSGRRIVAPPVTRSHDIKPDAHNDQNWPGREFGLSQREAEMLALITQGHSNADIAASTYLSPNSVKSYIRAAYRKIGAGRRSEAIVWGVRHGFLPGVSRRGGGHSDLATSDSAS